MSIASCSKCYNSNNNPEKSPKSKDYRHGTIRGSTPPSTEYFIPHWTRQPRDNEELCQWPDEECCEGRGNIFHRLPETEYPSLTFEWYYFLHNRLFCGFSYRREHHKTKKSDSNEPDRRNRSKERTDNPENEIHEEEGLYGILSESILSHYHSSDDKSYTRESQDDSPDFYRYE